MRPHFGFLPVRSRLRPVLAALAVVFAVAVSPRDADAVFWPDGDWKDRKHKLKVCLKDPNNKCPAGMADSIQAAINLWNAKSTTWQFTWTTDCSEADITIECGRNRSLGTTYWRYRDKENTSARILIKDNADWGWCDDKYELVSTIAHELGHCCRLKDTAASDQSQCMRGRQNKAGHARGPAPADSREAATSDTAGAAAAARTDPPGGQDQQPYFGVITPEPSSPPFELDRAISVDVIPYQPAFLNVLNAFPVGPEAIQWQAIPSTGVPDMQLFYVLIDYGTSFSLYEGIFYSAVRPFDPIQQPHAVAPPDTTVPTDTSEVLLYTDLSFHDDATDEMAFGWIVSDDLQLQSQGSVTSLSLPVGEHIVRLQAVDQYGFESEDEMRVLVLSTTDVGGAPETGLALDFPVPFRIADAMPIGFGLPAAGEASVRIYDVQGRLVRTVLSGPREAGQHQTAWNLRDESGRVVAPGIYLCSLKLGANILTEKVVLTQ